MHNIVMVTNSLTDLDELKKNQYALIKKITTGSFCLKAIKLQKEIMEMIYFVKKNIKKQNKAHQH